LKNNNRSEISLNTGSELCRNL